MVRIGYLFLSVIYNMEVLLFYNYNPLIIITQLSQQIFPNKA